MLEHSSDNTSFQLLLPRQRGQEASPETTEALRIEPKNALVIRVNGRQGGTWAGVASLAERAYLELRETGNQDILERHNYELHMALPEYRDQLPLKAGSLTDLAHASEKTRNFPAKRAYRIVHGLVDLMIRWRQAIGPDKLCVILVEDFAALQHLARRFFLETARRAFLPANIRVVLAGESAVTSDAIEANYLQAFPVAFPSPLVHSLARVDPIGSDDEARELLESLVTLESAELCYQRLLDYYNTKGDTLGAARAALAALCVCNHFGYYHEANTFVDTILPRFDDLVQGSQERRWNFTGNIFQSYIGLGATGKARQVIEQLSQPYLTESLFRAKMEYILGIIDLRYEKPPRLSEAERHLCRAVAHIEEARNELDEHEYAFQKVFMDNGVAFLRAKQGRRAEAIRLCQTGYCLLTEKLGDEAHRLHRSVLQYNTAQVYSMMGDLDAALEHYEWARAMDPNYSEYYNEIANILQRQEEYDRALAYYERAAKLSPPYPEVYFNKSVCLARVGKWLSALESCSYSLDLDPDQADGWLIRAEIHDQLARVEEALQDYDRAISLASDLIAARVNKAVLLFNTGRAPDALMEMNRVIAIDENNAEHYENRAAIYKQLLEWNLCRQDLEKAERLRNGKVQQELGAVR